MCVEQVRFGNRLEEIEKMKKKIMAVMLSLVLVLGMIPISNVLAQTKGAKFTVEASKTTANPGDEITFSIYVEDAIPFTGIEIVLGETEGLTYVANSGKIVSGLKEQMGFAEASFTEVSKKVLFGNDLPYTLNGKLKLAEFKCTVDDSASGNYTMGISVEDFTDEEFESHDCEVVSASVQVVIPVTGVSLDKETLTVAQFDDVIPLVATVTPANATNKELKWKSSDDTIVEVTNDGVVTGMKKGTATVTVETVDGNFKDTCVVTVNCTHNVGHSVPAEESTCLKQGHGAYDVCDDCGEITSGSDALLPLGDHKGGTATCKELAICEVCHQPHGNYAKHQLTKHKAVDADHKQPGNIEYYTCDVCEKYFSDGNGTTEIQQKDTVLSQIPHSHATTWSKDTTHHWKECPCGDKAEYGTHVYDNTCDTTCNICGAIRTIEHNYSTIWSKDASEHWHECTICHDKADKGTHGYDNACDTTCNTCGATRTIQHNYSTTWSKDANGHWYECTVCHVRKDEGNHGYDNACDTTCNTCGATRTIQHNYSTTWSVDNNGHWHECTVCHVRKDEGNHSGGTAKCNAKAVCTTCQNEYGSFGGHKLIEKIESQYLKSAATCKDKAVYYKSCEYCKEKDATTFETGSKNVDNHVGGTEVRDAVEMECDKNGYTGDTYCLGCGEKVQTGTDVLAKHNLSKVNAKDATHDANGNIAYFDCAKCDKFFKDEQAAEEVALKDTVILKGEHAYDATLKSDKDNHWKECSCGDKIEVKAHEFGEFKVTKEANATEKGSKEKECSVCGYKIVEEIPATGKLSSPQTADGMNWMIWMVLALVSIGSVSIVCVNKKRR